MVMLLERETVEEIARIGRLRKPNEAAGVLLPFPFRGKQVLEAPNRSLTPLDFFEMRGEDLVQMLEPFAAAYPDELVWNEITIWHTHPGGNVGPSTYDMQHKIADLKHLVISIPEEGDALATWY